MTSKVQTVLSKQEASDEKMPDNFVPPFRGHLPEEVKNSIQEANFSDSIYRQYVPSNEEQEIRESELSDPIGDEAHRVMKGLIHRYTDRVLFKVTAVCPVYCRFCFRKEMIGHDTDSMKPEDIDNAVAYIAEHKEISEVIFSGGDPFVLSPRRLKSLIERLSFIPHVQFIRFHTRVPVVKPKSVNDDLLAALKTNKRVIVVLHTNHAQELTDNARAAIEKLRAADIELLSQNVLLKGVNNKVDTLATLYKELMGLGVKPYYLHHPDKAKGTEHFCVSIEEGVQIYKALRGQVSGHLLPQYVLDIPGGFGKVPINSDWVCLQKDGSYLVTDIHGDKHQYWD